MNYLQLDYTQLNSKGYPLISCVYTSGTPYIGSMDALSYNTISEMVQLDLGTEKLQNIVSYNFLYPFQHFYQNGPFAYDITNSGIIYFYDNKDVYTQYVTEKYNKAIDTLTAGYSEQNQKSWNKKSDLAFAYYFMDSAARSGCVSNPNYNMLVQEANQRLLTLDDLILTKILPKAMYFENAHGILTGKWSYYISGITNFVGTEIEINNYLSNLVIDYSF